MFKSGIEHTSTIASIGGIRGENSSNSIHDKRKYVSGSSLLYSDKIYCFIERTRQLFVGFRRFKFTLESKWKMRHTYGSCEYLLEGKLKVGAQL